jgi:integrase
MAKTKLSCRFVRKVACPADLRKIDYFDIRHPGFMLEVRSSGRKTFYQRYRDARGRERQYKIGAAHILTVSQARKKARLILAEALLGKDPQREREELRAIPTLRTFIQEQYLPFVRNAKRSWRTDETVLRLHILPAIGKIPMDEISDAPIARLLQRMRERGYASGTTNRVLVLLRYAFNLAKKWQVPGVSTNPTVGLKTEPDACRERYLTTDELRRLMAALQTDENQVAAKAITLLLLTGARRNEITHAKWEHIGSERRTLLVPISKTGRPRLITLNAAAIDLLKSIDRSSGNPFIFPSPLTGRPCPSLHFPWSRIKRNAGLAQLRLHDLRHSFASLLVNEGISLYVVQHLLGHTQPRMTQRYAHLGQPILSDAAETVGRVVMGSDETGLKPFASPISVSPLSTQAHPS